MRSRLRAGVTLATALATLVALAAGCSPNIGSDPRDATAAGDAHRDAGEGPRTTTPPTDGSVDVVRTVAEGLSSPWGLVRLPSGDLLVGARDEGVVRRVAVATGKVTEVGEVPGVAPGGEGGLLGLAYRADPAPGGTLFAYHTTASDNRISRFRYQPSRRAGEQLEPAGDVLTGIPRGELIHNGGGLAFGPDGMLYAATGDATESALAQDKRSLAGKILRLHPETGEPAPGNPDPGSPVYSLGHRNVQGLAWDAADRLWASEFGQHTWDELNRIVPGGNYGWPEHEGRGGAAEGFRDPVAQWRPAEASPSGLAFRQGSLWMAGLRGERLWRVPLAGNEPAAAPQAFLTARYGRLRAVLPAGTDELFLVTSETDGRGSPEAGDDRILLLRVS